MGKGELFYTYIDECKQNYLTQVLRENFNIHFQEYSITSLTFRKESYENDLELRWKTFREKYNFNSKEALHFVEFRKLLSSEFRSRECKMYDYFVVDGDFCIYKLKEFFYDLKDILLETEFFIVHTDFYWNKKIYLTKRNKFNSNQFKKTPSRNIAPNILNAVPYVAMKKHLDSLLLSFLKRRIENDKNGVEDGYYFDEEIPKNIYTKLRFDADGKEFDARTDLKKAYSHTVAIGSDNVQQDVAVEILDEIRFIRKEEVGSDYTPSHCGLEIVDFLCSMISGETRIEEYKKENESLLNIEKGKFLNIEFEDGEVLNFYELIMSRIAYKTITYLNY